MQETEQSLLEDVTSSLGVLAKRIFYRWPSTFEIIAR
jgi:hypothetical protein